MFARNFYNFKLIALALAFTINFILLFFKVGKGYVVSVVSLYLNSRKLL